jgi:hypothetical protein
MTMTSRELEQAATDRLPVTTVKNMTGEQADLLAPVETIDKEAYIKSTEKNPVGSFVGQYAGKLASNITFGTEKLIAKNGLVVLGDMMISDVMADRERRDTLRRLPRPELTTPEDYKALKPLTRVGLSIASAVIPTIPKEMAKTLGDNAPAIASSIKNIGLSEDMAVWDSEAKKFGLTGDELKRIGEISDDAPPIKRPGQLVSDNTIGRYIRNVGWAWYHNAEKRFQELQPEVAAKSESTNPVDIAATTLADATSSVFAAVGASITMGTAIPAIAFGAYQATEEYVGSRAVGKPRDLSVALGITAGTTEGALEYAGLEAFLKFGGGRLMFTTKGMVVEALQEFSQSLASGSIETIFGIKEFNAENAADILTDSLISAAAGAVMGGVTAGMLATTLHKNMTKALRESGLPKARAKEIVDKWLANTEVEVCDILADMGGFTESDFEYVDKDVERARAAAGKPVNKPGKAPIGSEMPADIRTYDIGNIALKARVQNITAAMATEEKAANKLKAKIEQIDADVAASGMSVEDIDIARTIAEKIDAASSTPPKSFPLYDHEGYQVGYTGNKSGYPKYFQNKEYTAKETLNIIDKKLKGEKQLTEKQQAIFDDLMAGEKELQRIAGTEEAISGEKGPVTPIQEKEHKKKAGALMKEYGQLRASLREKEIELITYAIMDQTGADTEVEGKVTIRASVLNRARIVYAKQQIQRFKEGYKAGVKATGADVKSFQTYLTKLVTEATYLTDTQSARILATIKSTQTEGQFVKRMGELEMRIGELEQANVKKAVISGVYKILGKAESKGSGTKRKVKLDADTQEIFDKINAMRRDPAFTMGYPSTGNEFLDWLMNDLYNVESLNPTTESLLSAYDDFAFVYAHGIQKAKRLRAIRKDNIRAKIDAAADDIRTALKKDTEIIPGQEAKPQGMGLHRLLPGLRSFPGLMSLLARETDTKLNESNIEQITDVDKATRYTESILQKHTDSLSMGMQEIFGLDDTRALRKKLEKDTVEDIVIPIKKEVDMGLGQPSVSEEKTVTISRMAARKKWMEWQNMDGQIRLRRYNWFTVESIAAIEAVLTKEDFEFIKFQRDMYDGLYNKVNEIFKQLKGYNLDYTDYYTPFYGESTSMAETNLMEKVVSRMLESGAAAEQIDDASALKARLGGSALKYTNDVDVLGAYIMDMTHFIGWAKTASELGAIFSDREVRGLIVRTTSKKVLKKIDTYINTFTRGSIQKSATDNWAAFEKMRVNWTKSVLAVNPKVGFPKQVSGFLLYASETPVGAFTKNLLDLPRAIASGDIKVLTDNAYMKNRWGGNFIRDIKILKELTSDENMLGLRQNPTLDNTLLWFMKAGDRSAILAGGWAYYKSLIDKGVPPEVALNKFFATTNRLQQSADLSQMPTLFQDPNFIVRLYTTFKLAPNQYFEAMMSTLINARRMGPAEFAKKIVISHFIQPMLWQFLSDGFNWDDKKQLRAAILGPFASLFITGDILTNLIDYVVAKSFSEDPKGSGFSTPLGSWTKDMLDTAKAVADYLEKGDISYEDIASAMRDLAGALGPIGGAPTGALRYASSAMMGVEAIREGEYLAALKYFLDYSAYTVRGKKQTGWQ